VTRTWIIVRKEWDEVFRNFLVLATVVFTPLVLVTLALVTIGTTTVAIAHDPKMAAAPDKDMIALVGESCRAMSGAGCMQAYLGTLYLLMFLMIPLVLPGTFASYSVVGEKTSRTLEPLLATPITTAELLAGKAIAAALPAVVATWGAAAIYYVGSWFLIDHVAFYQLARPHWLVAVGVLGPLLAVFSTVLTLMISSRSTDPRAAQQLSAMVVLPVVLVLVGQSLGFLVVDPTLIGVLCAIFVLVDLGLGWLAVQTFEREAILTRWK
jgi:ABC-2 type transport system permease protein